MSERKLKWFKVMDEITYHRVWYVLRATEEEAINACDDWEVGEPVTEEQRHNTPYEATRVRRPPPHILNSLTPEAFNPPTAEAAKRKEKALTVLSVLAQEPLPADFRQRVEARYARRNEGGA